MQKGVLTMVFRENWKRTAAAFTLTLFLTSCAPVPMTPGGEPFGEQTASTEKTERIYTTFTEAFRQEPRENWDGFTISWTDHGAFADADLYWTEAYTAACSEDPSDGEYLWFDGWLYHRYGETVTYREMPWEEFRTAEITDGLWTMLQGLLNETPEEMKYKYIPLSKGSGNLLTVRYPFDEEQAGDYAKISASMYSDGTCESVSLQWNAIGEVGKFENVQVIAAFYPLAGSDSLQAERKIWSFAHDCGLLEDGVPAISTQDEDREGCQAVIQGIDFSALRARATRQEDLCFPEFPMWCIGPEAETAAAAP